MSINITEAAASEVKKVMQEQSMNSEEYSLKVGVSGGGCAGFTYDLGFEKTSDIKTSDCILSNQFGVNVMVDNKSDLFLDGTVVDFYAGIDKRGFTFSNPQAKGGCCGCGNSFSN